MKKNQIHSFDIREAVMLYVHYFLRCNPCAAVAGCLLDPDTYRSSTVPNMYCQISWSARNAANRTAVRYGQSMGRNRRYGGY